MEKPFTYYVNINITSARTLCLNYPAWPEPGLFSKSALSLIVFCAVFHDTASLTFPGGHNSLPQISGHWSDNLQLKKEKQVSEQIKVKHPGDLHIRRATSRHRYNE